MARDNGEPPSVATPRFSLPAQIRPATTTDFYLAAILEELHAIRIASYTPRLPEGAIRLQERKGVSR